MILGPVALARLLGRGSVNLSIIGMIGGILILIVLFYMNLLTGYYPLLILLPLLLAFIGKR